MYFRVIFVTKSMTEGKPLKLILQFAVPLLLGNLLQQMYNLSLIHISEPTRH